MITREALPLQARSFAKCFLEGLVYYLNILYSLTTIYLRRLAKGLGAKIKQRWFAISHPSSFL
jgi:hypothetical protein